MGFMWRGSYSIGHPAIDAEHQELFKLAQAFFEANGRLEQTDCAMHLFQYTRTHFDHEEALMREIAYPGLIAHVEQHLQLIDKLNAVAEKVATETLDRMGLKAFLTAWLVGHIVTFDTKLSSYVKQKQENGVESGR
jgi:hemerythrin